MKAIKKKKYIIIRKGCSNIYQDKLKKPHDFINQSTVSANKITKKYFIQLQFGRKSIKKILNEKKLSRRQIANLLLLVSDNNPYEIVFIPLEIYGMKNYKRTLNE